jgi:hypothetical protein
MINTINTDFSLAAINIMYPLPVYIHIVKLIIHIVKFQLRIISNKSIKLCCNVVLKYVGNLIILHIIKNIIYGAHINVRSYPLK